jgi:predicted nucleotidyltransferase
METQSIQSVPTLALPVPMPPSNLFAHNVTSEILTLLTDNSHIAFGIREISRATDHPHRSVSSAVDELETVSLVTTKYDGGKKLVQINRDRLRKPDDPVTQIPQSEFQEPIRTLVTRLTDQLDKVRGIVLFGSVARGAADRQSDIDCFVLVEEEQALAQQTAHELTSHLGEERFQGDRYTFHVLVESVASARKHGERLQEIFAEGLTLVDSDALRQLKTEVLTDGQ